MGTIGNTCKKWAYKNFLVLKLSRPLKMFGTNNYLC
jgi:hypothetical protein